MRSTSRRDPPSPWLSWRWRVSNCGEGCLERASPSVGQAGWRLALGKPLPRGALLGRVTEGSAFPGEEETLGRGCRVMGRWHRDLRPGVEAAGGGKMRFSSWRGRGSCVFLLT